MKRLILLIVALVLVALAFLYTTQCNKNKKVEVVKIGIDLPLTGNYAYWGNEFKEGAEIFASSAEGLEVIFEDNHGKPNDAVSAANKLLKISKVDAFVSLFAPFSFPLRDIAEKANVPFISTFNSSTSFTTDYSYCYSDFATHDTQLPLLVKFITDSMQLNRGLYLCVNDDYGVDGAKVLSKLLKEKNISISGEYFNTGESEFRNFFAKSLNDSVEFVFVIARDRDLINAVNQIRERNKDLLILGVGSFDAPVVWEGISTENQANIIFASSYFEKDYNDESKAFYEEFYKRNQRDPNYPAIFGYTICQYLSQAISDAKKKNVPLTDILNTLNYQSIRGNIIMQANHMIYSSIAIYKRENDTSVPLSIEKEPHN